MSLLRSFGLEDAATASCVPFAKGNEPDDALSLSHIERILTCPSSYEQRPNLRRAWLATLEPDAMVWQTPSLREVRNVSAETVGLASS